MGNGASKNASPDSSHGGKEGEAACGGQLYVSLKMEYFAATGELVPHVYGSVPIVGSWDPSKALSMERESASMWELSFVVPPNHETLDFKFLLKSKCRNAPSVAEEGPNRLLKGGTLEGDARLAYFRVGPAGSGGGSEDVVECRVIIKADMVSPFDLAASWRAYQENLKPSTVRGIPDVSINASPAMGFENGSTASLELDLEHYVIPSPASCANSVHVSQLRLLILHQSTEMPQERIQRSLLLLIFARQLLFLGCSSQNQWGHFHHCRSRMVRGAFLWTEEWALLDLLNQLVQWHSPLISNWILKQRTCQQLLELWQQQLWLTRCLDQRKIVD